MIYTLRCDGCETVSCVVGSWADHVRIMLGSVPHCKWGSTVFRACAVDRIPLWFATVGSFPQCKWDCKWCWWMSCRWNSIVFCNSVSADRIVMAASRLLRAVAAFVILLSFAAGSRKSSWSGCMKAATVICQQIFSILALVIFLLKILLKSVSKYFFFRSGVEILRFWSYNFRRCCA